MTDRIAFTAKDSITEGSAFSVVARFRTGSADAAPTNARYRVDDQDEAELVSWTSLSPATSITITIPASVNTCDTDMASEQRLLTVIADYGLSTQFIAQYRYEVRNTVPTL